ncbi:hypothetical protein M885DRAFT_552420 [Pelagophyceae sp. CCMP2097]|nr:hypothetical protein M885DRAFT_552420 [Pelagophyceae sp. CCMP2097]
MVRLASLEEPDARMWSPRRRRPGAVFLRSSYSCFRQGGGDVEHGRRRQRGRVVAVFGPHVHGGGLPLVRRAVDQCFVAQRAGAGLARLERVAQRASVGLRRLRASVALALRLAEKHVDDERRRLARPPRCAASPRVRRRTASMATSSLEAATESLSSSSMRVAALMWLWQKKSRVASANCGRPRKPRLCSARRSALSAVTRWRITFSQSTPSMASRSSPATSFCATKSRSESTVSARSVRTAIPHRETGGLGVDALNRPVRRTH